MPVRGQRPVGDRCGVGDAAGRRARHLAGALAERPAGGGRPRRPPSPARLRGCVPCQPSVVILRRRRRLRVRILPESLLPVLPLTVALSHPLETTFETALASTFETAFASASFAFALQERHGHSFKSDDDRSQGGADRCRTRHGMVHDFHEPSGHRGSHRIVQREHEVHGSPVIARDTPWRFNLAQLPRGTT